MSVAAVVERWREFERLVQEKGLGWALHYAPRTLRFVRYNPHPHGGDFAHLLPADYVAFVDTVGYPIFGTEYYDREGISFLPPEGIAQISVGVGIAMLSVGVAFEQLPKASKAGPTKCPAAFFAGDDFSDIEGFAFAPGYGGDNVVWLVEGGILREECGAIDAWMLETIDHLEKRVIGLSDAAIAGLETDNDGEDDPHRVIDYSLDQTYDGPPYSPGDLRLHWVREGVSSPPYDPRYGLIDDSGTWLIPMGETFRHVRPFRDGIAEVVLNTAGSTYGGPWTKIRVDGTPT
jgi:hypothetical protein